MKENWIFDLVGTQTMKREKLYKISKRFCEYHISSGNVSILFCSGLCNNPGKCLCTAVEDIQYCRRISSVINTVEGYLHYRGGCSVLLGDMISNVKIIVFRHITEYPQRSAMVSLYITAHSPQNWTPSNVLIMSPTVLMVSSYSTSFTELNTLHTLLQRLS